MACACALFEANKNNGLHDPPMPPPTLDEAGIAVAGTLTDWEHFWEYMNREFEPKNYNVAGRYYDAYTDYRRPRSMQLRAFLTEHGNRHRAAKARRYETGEVAKSHTFFKNARMTPDQIRWSLAPVGET